MVSNFETKQDRNAICQNILDDVIANFETSEDRKMICEGILSDVVEDILAKEQLRLLNNIKEKFNWLKNEGKEKKCDFDYFEIIGSSRSLAMKCEDIFGPIKIKTVPIKSDNNMEVSTENLDIKTKHFELVPPKNVIIGGMNCEDIFGFKEDRQKKIKVEGEKICKIILNDAIANFETKQDRKNISRGILDTLIENLETSETRKPMHNNEILESLVTNFEMSDKTKIICGKNLNSKIENEELKEHMANEKENSSKFDSGKSCISDISPEKMDLVDNDNIKLQDSDGKLICQNILDNVIENLDIGEMICEETLNDLVGNLELKSDQQTNSNPFGMDIFSRLLGF